MYMTLLVCIIYRIPYTGAVLQGKVDITNILPTNKLPVNSLDVESRHLVCSTDSEMLYLVPNLTFR